jgi:hypothetical protein
MAKRRCKGKTKAGKRCRAYPLHDSQYCLAHDELSRASVGFGGPEAGRLGGRPKSPRVVDVLRERVEARIEEVIAPYFEALTRAVLHATYEGDVIVSDAPDLGARMAAAEKLLDRVYGKPRQTIEHAGPQDGAPIAVEFTMDDKAREAIAGALRGRPAEGQH